MRLLRDRKKLGVRIERIEIRNKVWCELERQALIYPEEMGNPDKRARALGFVLEEFVMGRRDSVTKG